MEGSPEVIPPSLPPPNMVEGDPSLHQTRTRRHALPPSAALPPSLHLTAIATASPELDEFLDFIGDRVRMKGFDGYRAQLDNKSE